MTYYNAQLSKGDYRLQFFTDDKERFKMVEKAVQMAVDQNYIAGFVKLIDEVIGLTKKDSKTKTETFEKQTPAKIKVVDGNDVCPRCGFSYGLDCVRKKLFYWRKDYCERCGQALDWEV